MEAKTARPRSKPPRRVSRRPYQARRSIRAILSSRYSMRLIRPLSAWRLCFGPDHAA